MNPPRNGPSREIVLRRIVGRNFRKHRMHARAVIALRIILEHQLPIGLHVVLDPFRRAQFRQIPMRKFSVQRREPFFQWPVAASLCRGVSKIHENESFPECQIHRVQRIIGFIKIRHFDPCAARRSIAHRARKSTRDTDIESRTNVRFCLREVACHGGGTRCKSHALLRLYHER